VGVIGARIVPDTERFVRTRKGIDMSKEKINELTELAKPMIKYLNDNHHPYVTVIITPTSVELLEGIMSNPNIEDYIKD